MVDAPDIIKKGGPIRILAVDDNAAALYATSRVLRAAGYEVVGVATGAAALEAAANADLIVLDVNLPDIDGFEVCRRLRARPETSQIPVLHLSATFTNSADFALGFEAGADGYLTRPVEAPVLVATVRTLLFARHADFVRRGLDAKLRTMFNLAPVAIAILDEKSRYESVNPAYCALTGYPAEELIGRPGDSFLATESRLLDSETMAHLAAGKHWTRRLQFIKRDASIVEIEWQIVKENISGTRILVATDVTEMARAEEARESLLASERAARSEAERSNRLKEEFLATLSHELRNPLNAILGWATLLSRKPDLPEAVVQGLQAIERNSKFQAQMISDLLDYAGITFGKMRLIAETIDPYPVVRAALEVVSGTAQAAGVAIRSSFEAGALSIEADPARLQQIVWNLLSNAVKFSTKGGEVRLETGRSGEFLSLVVTDQGRGIEPEFLPRIFERFSQQDATTTRSHGGLGLGLAIVRQLVELHGGSIQASSAGKGRGATFTVKLPLSQNAVLPASSDSQTLRALDFSGVVALIVEDDADARELTKRILRDVGAAVVEASSADEALACIATSKANILISDIGMAHQDGYQLVRRLRIAGYGADALPAIALTAFARMEDRSEALAAGFQDHLAKPLDPQTLISRVAALRKGAR
ncbi:MAG: response regulator [Pseudomonadota bacterium]|nr:response regulator [Pseudomonadota bacterium]